MTKIILERDKCIGCGSCESVCPEYWKMKEDGKTHLKNSKEKPKEKKEELEIKEIGCNQKAADVCPVQCIHIIKE